MNKPFAVILVSLLTLTACGAEKPSEEAADTTSSAADREIASEADRVIRETKNVSYSGTVQVLGISVYMEGSHKLSLQDGRFILLESDSVDLNGYVGENVDVVGAIRPTVESDAMIMRVEQISLQVTEDEDLEGGENGEEPKEGEELDEESSSAASEEQEEEIPPTEDDEVPVAAAEEEEPVAKEPEAPQSSPEFLTRVKNMAEEEFTSGNWTQEYCTAHIGFCIPIHRNWWFKSFGATSSHYWHVEMNSAPVEELGEGPLVVDLNGESIESLGIDEGEIRTEGDLVVGYRSWTNGRHFKIHGHSSLRGAIEYITENLRSE